MEAPAAVYEKYASELSAIPNPMRRTFAAQTCLLDESAAALMAALKARPSMLANTLLVVASDNGANPAADSGGSNWPLRGMKGFYFEGGIRTHALVHSALLPARARGTTHAALFSVVDWLPTIVGGFLGAPGAVPAGLDGIDLWGSLTNTAGAAARDELLVNVDTSSDMMTGETVHTAALRMGDLKLLVGVQYQPVWPVPRNSSPPEGGPQAAWEW